MKERTIERERKEGKNGTEQSRTQEGKNRGKRKKTTPRKIPNQEYVVARKAKPETKEGNEKYLEPNGYANEVEHPP